MQEDLKKIADYLDKYPMDMNIYRKKVGDGRSQVFGIVFKRDGSYGYSRQCRKHPELWYLLEEFGRKWIRVRWDAIQVNQNYTSKPHRDVGNIGFSEIVGLGDYTEGQLCIMKDTIEKHDIKGKPLVFDGSRYTHWTEPWSGNRYSLVFFKISGTKGYIRQEKWIPVFFGDKWLLGIQEDNYLRLVDKYSRTVDTIKLSELYPGLM